MDKIFSGATEIGEISFGLLGSIVASSIFYFFVVYLHERRTKKIIDPIIAGRLRTFHTSSYLLKKGLYELKGLPIPQRLPAMEEFGEICDGITLHDPAPLISGTTPFQPGNWYEYFQYFFDSDRYTSRLLYDQVIFLTPEIVKLLDDIQYSDFQRALDMYKTHEQFDQLSGTANPCWSYLKRIQDLADIANDMNESQ